MALVETGIRNSVNHEVMIKSDFPKGLHVKNLLCYNVPFFASRQFPPAP